MDEETVSPPADAGKTPADTGKAHAEEIAKISADFRNRLMLADLRSEAIKAGMVDLDGLKLIDVSKFQLGDDDHVVDGTKIMDDLRRRKAWLFRPDSSSSPAVVPATQPVRHKSAMEMSDTEYAAARAAVTRQQR